jgi:hypothetical protein
MIIQDFVDSDFEFNFIISIKYYWFSNVDSQKKSSYWKGANKCVKHDCSSLFQTVIDKMSK